MGTSATPDSATEAYFPALLPVDFDAAKPQFLLRHPITLVGRRQDVHIRLASPHVSRHHALLFSSDGSVFVRDLGSRTGVRVNDQPVQMAQLKDDDLLRIGKFTFRFRAPLHRRSANRPFPPAELRLDGHSPIPADRPIILIGRGNGCDIQLSHPDVSTVHAVVIFALGRAFIHDLHSRTGTWVNDRRISKLKLHGGDGIRIGPALISYMRLDRLAPAAAPQPRITFADIPEPQFAVSTPALPDPAGLSQTPPPASEPAVPSPLLAADFALPPNDSPAAAFSFTALQADVPQADLPPPAIVTTDCAVLETVDSPALSMAWPSLSPGHDLSEEEPADPPPDPQPASNVPEDAIATEQVVAARPDVPAPQPALPPIIEPAPLDPQPASDPPADAIPTEQTVAATPDVPAAQPALPPIVEFEAPPVAAPVESIIAVPPAPVASPPQSTAPAPKALASASGPAVPNEMKGWGPLPLAMFDPALLADSPEPMSLAAPRISPLFTPGLVIIALITLAVIFAAVWVLAR